MSGQTLLYSGKNFSKFPDIPEVSIVDKLDLSSNKISDFSGIKDFHLKQLILDNNSNFSSFVGVGDFINPKLDDNNSIIIRNTLESFSCQKTPLGNSPFFALMSVIVFGNSLKILNDQRISKSTYKLASLLRNDTFDLLIHGWIITSTKPIRMLNVQNRKRKVIYPQIEDTQKSPQKDRSIDVTNEYEAISVYSTADSNKNKSNTSTPKKRSAIPKKSHKKSPKKSPSSTPKKSASNTPKKSQSNTENDDQPADEDERLRVRFNLIHQEFLSSIGPIFNNNNEYIVYKTGETSPSRMGRTRSQAANYTSPSKTQTQAKKEEQARPATSMNSRFFELSTLKNNSRRPSPFKRDDYFAKKREQMEKQKENEQTFEQQTESEVRIDSDQLEADEEQIENENENQSHEEEQNDNQFHEEEQNEDQHHEEEQNENVNENENENEFHEEEQIEKNEEFIQSDENSYGDSNLMENDSQGNGLNDMPNVDDDNVNVQSSNDDIDLSESEPSFEKE